MESFIEICIAIGLQSYISFGAKRTWNLWDIVTDVMCLMLIIATFAILFLILVYLNKNRDELEDNEEFNDKFGSLYDNLDLRS